LLMPTKTAKEKYLEFIESHDAKIIQRLTQYHIASFLGITPESLSHVRRSLAESNNEG